MLLNKKKQVIENFIKIIHNLRKDANKKLKNTII
jgi:hypothetical protein